MKPMKALFEELLKAFRTGRAGLAKQIQCRSLDELAISLAL